MMITLFSRTMIVVTTWLFMLSSSAAFLIGPIQSSYFIPVFQDVIRGRGYPDGSRVVGCGRASYAQRWKSPQCMAATSGEGGEVSERDSSIKQEAQDKAAAATRRSKELNLACNDVVRTVLDGNVSDEKARALALRQRLEAQRDDLVVPDDDMSELFFENLLLVCQHELHPDIGRLRGEYGKAWRTILHYIEDAGWQLTDPPFSITG